MIVHILRDHVWQCLRHDLDGTVPASTQWRQKPCVTLTQCWGSLRCLNQSRATTALKHALPTKTHVSGPHSLPADDNTVPQWKSNNDVNNYAKRNQAKMTMKAEIFSWTIFCPSKKENYKSSLWWLMHCYDG